MVNYLEINFSRSFKIIQLLFSIRRHHFDLREVYFHFIDFRFYVNRLQQNMLREIASAINWTKLTLV